MVVVGRLLQHRVAEVAKTNRGVYHRPARKAMLRHASKMQRPHRNRRKAPLV